MANAEIRKLRDEWQEAVCAHESIVRAAKRSGLNGRELDQFAQPYLMRVDAAFTRLKQAEVPEHPAELPLWK